GQEALELAVALGDSALQMLASHTLGQACYAIGDFGRAGELLWRRVEVAERGGVGQGIWRAQYRRADRVPGVAGTNLEHARGLCRGPAPGGGGAPPRHAGRPRGHTDHGPRL